ncbi:MAG: AIR synthase family protein [Acetatifactor sp.]
MRTGKLSENMLKRSVLRQIKYKRQEVLSGAGIGEDCAILSFADEENLVTCVQEAAAVFRENTDWLAHLVIKCANNLAAAGGEPVAVSLVLMLPEGAEETELKLLMKQAEDACESLGIAIAGGQTTVTRAVTVPVATVTGYGKVVKEADYSAKAAAPGQDVVISKWIGLEGTAILAKNNREKLLERYPVYFVEEAAGFDRYLSLLPEAATAVKSGVCAMHDASEGGIFGALWELAEGAGVGLTIDLKKLPLRQETVEVCEQCNVNPYELLSGGCLVMTAEDGPGLVAALEAEHIPAVIVGKVTGSNDRVILNEDEVRYMEKAQQDEIYKKMQE